MASRHLSRSIAMQTLYEWDFNNQEEKRLPEILEKNYAEFGPGLEDKKFPAELVMGVIEKLPKLDTIIEKAAPEWPISQIAMVDRNILRLGLYELLFGDHAAVPPKVAINEAIELAKTFGGEASGKFVNGVLGTIYRELGEPGKEHPRRGEGRGSEGLDAAARQEEYVGAVIFRREAGGRILWAMVRDIFNHWTLVKGHLRPGEAPEAGALRKAEEEVGLGGRVEAALGENTYPAADESGRAIRRHVRYFLIETNDLNISLGPEAGLLEAKWFPMAEVLAQKHYEDLNHIIESAMEKITKLSR